jgi:hypothetical protein
LLKARFVEMTVELEGGNGLLLKQVSEGRGERDEADGVTGEQRGVAAPAR